jgi:hypothetical protein
VQGLRFDEPTMKGIPMIVAITHATGMKLAEVGFLLILIAGVWLVASEIAALGAARWHKFRIFVAGGCLAAAGILLIVATHWGGFG